MSKLQELYLRFKDNLGGCDDVPDKPINKDAVVAEFYLAGLERATREINKYREALSLALYYIEGDATYEAVKEKVDKILAGSQPAEKK